MSEVTDITPEHNPIALAREMEERAKQPDCVTGFYILIFKDGTMEYEGCADRKKDLLWALELMKKKVLSR